MYSLTLKRDSERGSVLIVALLFAVVIAISLTSYIALANNSLKQASRSFYASSAVNLAEAGMEEAIACFNKLDLVPVGTPEDAWPGWTLNNTNYDASTSPFTPAATRTFTSFTPGPGASAIVKVFAQHYKGATETGPDPKIVVQSTITQNDGPPIQKIIEVTLRKRTLFGSGVTSILDVTSTGGGISVQSWDSDPDDNPSTPAVYYDELTNKTANATMASTQGNIDLGGGTKVFGYAKVSPAHTIIGRAMDLTEYEDPDRKSYDYDATFSMESAPTALNTISGNITNSRTFPDLVNHTPVTVGGQTVYRYQFNANKIDLGGSDNIKILPNTNVVFILTGSGDNVKVAGNAYFQIQAGASLHIYARGDVTLGGGGLLNDNFSASTFRIYGTNTTPYNTTGYQSVKVAGTSEFRGVIYAPNAYCEIKGGGSEGRFVGAVVGRRIHFNGDTEFVFDEEINDLTKPDYAVRQWKELQAQSERVLYNSVWSF